MIGDLGIGTLKPLAEAGFKFENLAGHVIARLAKNFGVEALEPLANVGITFNNSTICDV